MKVVEQSGHGGSVDVTFEGDVGVITMRRGQNRINEEFMDQMHTALDKVLANPLARAVVTTSEGRFYSNGMDLDWIQYIQESDPIGWMKRVDLTKLALRILTFPLPTIALINEVLDAAESVADTFEVIRRGKNRLTVTFNTKPVTLASTGHAFAGGALLAFHHDHVIMQNGRGWWSMSEVHIKLRLSHYTVALFNAKLSGRSVNEALVLGRRFTADEAKEAGIVHEVCTPQQMLPTALAWVKAVVPPNGFDRDHLQLMKRDVYKHALDLKDMPSRTVFHAKV